MRDCKHYDKHLETIRQYIGCLYELEECCTGGFLHILLDDDNYDNTSIIHCLRDCLLHPEYEESAIGKLICEEYIKLPIQQRRLLTSQYIGHWSCFDKGQCEKCVIGIGNEFEK